MVFRFHKFQTERFGICPQAKFDFRTLSKGQLLSEGNFGVLKSPKSEPFALASKIDQIKKNWQIIMLISDHLSCNIIKCLYVIDLIHFRG